jgi:hypothetical protein
MALGISVPALSKRIKRWGRERALSGTEALLKLKRNKAIYLQCEWC